MTEPKFTPGPWFARVKPGVHYVISDDSYIIATTYWRENNEERFNAALIAAAPEMYNAEKDKIVHLQTLKNQICCLLAPKKDTVVTLDFVLKYINEIIGDTENLLAKARGEGNQ